VLSVSPTQLFNLLTDFHKFVYVTGGHPNDVLSKYPTIYNDNMTDARTCEVEGTSAKHSIGP
jgi:hypothetical protein